ncbi:hypothetical protein EJ04DRAFT_310934 [Polyplosphaeria fusca]|uniref:Uncharacterized protein n=1 Tax=Polyplosphaeria fusca TaxID=682080 RepID=A0A9P4R9M0_9PLEO|nr:hypothetical protein EJ04DRAFT_310934 [Polyplosphaeria fusca]
MDISLSELYFRCHRSFQAALSAFGPQEHGPDLSKRDVESEFDKFRLWAGNVGAMHTGQRYKLSLDYRLRESPFYRERVTSFLNTLDQKVRHP